MKCSEASQLIAFALDGELSGVESRELGAHLDVCSSCRQEAAEQKKIQDALVALPAADPPSELLYDVMAQARLELQSVPAPVSAWSSTARPILALAATALLAIGLWLMWDIPGSNLETVPPLPGERLRPLTATTDTPGSFAEEGVISPDQRLYARVISEINWSSDGGRASSEIRFWAGSRQ